MSLVSLLMLLTVSNTSIISCQLLSVAHCFTSLDLLGSPGHRPTKDQTGGFPSLSVQILGTLDLRLQRLIDTKSKSLESLEPLESLVFGKHFRLQISSAYDWSRKPKKSPDLPPGFFNKNSQEVGTSGGKLSSRNIRAVVSYYINLKQSVGKPIGLIAVVICVGLGFAISLLGLELNSPGFSHDLSKLLAHAVQDIASARSTI